MSVPFSQFSYNFRSLSKKFPTIFRSLNFSYLQASLSEAVAYSSYKRKKSKFVGCKIGRMRSRLWFDVYNPGY